MRKKKKKFLNKNTAHFDLILKLNEETLFFFEKILLEARIRESIRTPFLKKKNKIIKNEIALLNRYLYLKKC